MERNDDDEQRRKKLEKGVYRADLFSDLWYIESVLRIFYEKKKKFSRNIFTREHTWMDQLYCIYRSIEKSICSTISASFPSACIVSFLAFISYMVFRLFFSLHKNRSKNFSGVSDMVYQGVWTAIFIFYTRSEERRVGKECRL